MTPNIYFKHACLHKAALVAALLTVALAITLFSQVSERGDVKCNPIHSIEPVLSQFKGAGQDLTEDGSSAAPNVQPAGAACLESPADIYARLCENATRPWREPTPIPTVTPQRPNFAQSMLETQTENR